MRTMLGNYVKNLKDNEVLYVRIAEKDKENFYEECHDLDIHRFFNGEEFRREDVRGLMGIRSDHKTGYVSALCFMAVAGERQAVSADGKDMEIIALDYDRMLKGENGRIVPDPDVRMNGEKLKGNVIVL